jgi:pilus assembly protein CpaF
MIKEFEQRKLKEVRMALGSGDFAEDEDALSCIETLVLRDPSAEQFSIAQLDSIIQKLFFRTRSRLGILQPLIEDRQVTEIMVNGPEHIFAERAGQIERCPFSFDSVEELEEIIRTVASQVHREINELQPIVDARLPDGSRVNGVYKNVAVNGPVLTIRRFSESYLTMDDLTDSGAISAEGASLVSILAACGFNIFVSGGTSSGKTTFLNALAASIPKSERVIVIEDSSELQLRGVENIVHMECRNSNTMGKGLVTMSQLIKTSLRMRPDRIIVGEVRGGEVLDMLQAMNTGHSGMSTGHGNSVEGMLQRLETMYMMAIPLQVDAIRAQIADALDIMVHLERLDDGTRRVVEVCEIAGFQDNRYVLNPLLVRNGPVLQTTGNRLKCIRKLEVKGEVYASRLREMGFIDS